MPGNYVLLETIDLTQSAASVTFDNIPQTGYTDLKIVYSGRDTTDSPGSVYIQFNGAGYNSTTLKVNGTGSSVSSSSHNNAYLGLVPGPSQTANTFSSGEIYIRNYTSSTNKSFSSDVVNENNATAAAQFLWAGLWANTAAITSVTLKTDQAFAQYSTFSLYGVAAVGTTPAVAPKATGGNIVANDGTYWYHAFLSSGTFTPQTALTCDYLVVAGGGSSAARNNEGSGGGGAGGLRSATTQALTTTNYSVIVGAGGAPGANNTYGSNGSATSFNGLQSAGGGAGAPGQGGTNRNGLAGGSGGGGTNDGLTSGTGGAGNTPSTSPSQGNNGGSGLTDQASYAAYGGGGGAVAAGGNASYQLAGNGGAGSSAFSSWGAATNTGQLSSSTRYYAGGGGGGKVGSGTAGSGGLGGGGNGTGSGAGVAGTPNTGGGAGGGGEGTNPGANGGSGIVIIRYAM